MSPSVPPIAPAIHAAGEETLDALLDFVRFVAKPVPLGLLLDEVPRRIAEIVRADIASLYLLERDGDELVLRGNVGFPLGARGRVRLRVGEGITGMAVEHCRPVSVVRASQHERYRAFPELNEEAYPVFLAVPILSHGRPLGALVVQRKGARAFDRDEIHLAVALTAPISAVFRHAQLVDEMREKTRRRTGGGTRKITLPGLPIVAGRVLGAIAAMRRPAATQKRGPTSDDAKQLHIAFELAERAVTTLRRRATSEGLGQEAAFLDTYSLIVADGRLRDRAFELLAEGVGIAHALGQLAREVARAANSHVGDPFLQERARDIEDLCDAILMLASPDARAELPQKAVLLGNDITVFDLIVSARAHPVGVALTERALGPRTRVLLKLLGVPAIVDVGGAFRWVAPGDVAVLDSDHGFLIVNPSKAEMAAVRAQRKKPPRSKR